MSSSVEIRRWSRKEYEMLIEAEFFRPDERLELVKGIVYQRPALTSWHAATIQAAQEVLRPLFSSGFHVRTQMALALTPDSEPVPDVSVVPGHWRDYLSAHPETAALVIEITELPARFDREEKSSVYAEAGIPEYEAARSPPKSPGRRLSFPDLFGGRATPSRLSPRRALRSEWRISCPKVWRAG
jgi:Uma2 family endonuclease